jgi:DNA helicase-2/ATP-dependent DNA helicase PcrA
MDSFSNLYSNLNPAQKLAVDTIEGPVMVIAGPGTGKTTILTLRIANILQKTDTPPSGILAITFTDAGVKAMKRKLRELIGSRADEVRIHTFHGFAASIMSEFPEHFIQTDGFTQMTDIEQDEIVREILEDEKFAQLRPLGKPDLYINPIISSISEAKREVITPAEIKAFSDEEIERIKNNGASVSTRGASKGELKADAKKQIERLERTKLFAEVYALYGEKKKEEKLLDYDDLILNVVLALGSDELLLRLIQEKFLYIHVDEHQDTNDSQNLMIRLLTDFFENPNIFIVGDEKQAIYRFQGASVENFLKFEKAWPEMKVISLEENYRSHQHILDASFAMIEGNYKEGEHEKLRVKLRSGNKKDATQLDLVNAKNRATAEKYLMCELRRIQKEEPEKTVAVISRTNKDVDRIVQRAEEEEVKISAERSIDIFSHPVGNLFFSLISFMQDPLDTESMSKTLIAGLWEKSFAEAITLVKQLRKGEFEEALKDIPQLASVRKLLVEDSPMLFLMNLAEISGFSKMVVADPAYVEVWRGIVNLSDRIVKQYELADPLELVERLLSYKQSSEGKRIKVSVGASEAKITAMTAHGSKGLEFDYVFILYATEESWLPKKRPSLFILPSKKLEKEGDEIRDARRLFYVALTRAKEHAVVIVPTEDVAGDLNTPLRFVTELDPDSVKTRDYGEEAEALDGKTHIYTAKAKAEKMIEYAKSELLERGLSVTALNHFLECPARFLFKSILRLPEATSATAEKGIAMHAAFNNIWKVEEKGRTEECITKMIEGSARESVGRSYLRAFEKEAIIKDLIKVAPIVAHSLYPHFHAQGEVKTETWNECETKTVYDGKEITIPLHGKLDTVIETDRDFLIFDYKTMKKMSDKEIKGETANSDGKYFRQLVFYKMLLRSHAEKSGKGIVPSLVFLTPDEKGNCDIRTLDISDKDIDDVRTHIRDLVKNVWSGEIVLGKCREEKCGECALKEALLSFL